MESMTVFGKIVSAFSTGPYLGSNEPYNMRAWILFNCVHVEVFWWQKYLNWQ
jgi:hypothetical protein